MVRFLALEHWRDENGRRKLSDLDVPFESL